MKLLDFLFRIWPFVLLLVLIVITLIAISEFTDWDWWGYREVFG